MIETCLVSFIFLNSGLIKDVGCLTSIPVNLLIDKTFFIADPSALWYLLARVSTASGFKE